MVTLTGVQLDTLEVTKLRCADVAYMGKLSNRFVVRIIAINSFYFFIIMSKKTEAKHKWKRFIELLNNEIRAGLYIKPSSNKLSIPVEKTTYMHPELLGSLLHAKK